MLYRYNVDVCYKLCLQAMVTKKCGCAFAAVHIRKPQSYDGPYCFHDYCNKALTSQQFECIQDFYANVNLSVDCSDCKMPECVSWDYTDYHSVLNYFANFDAEDFVDDFLDADHPSVSDMALAYGNISNVPDNFISKNFAKVTVSFTDMHIRHRVATKTMSGFSLFSALGGAFSFWIGCSIITFVEVIEWIVRLIVGVRYVKVDTTNDETTKSAQKM